MDEGREKGTRKGQMAPSSSQPSGSGHAPTESKHLPLLPRRRAQENHRLLSSCQGKRPILRPTPTASRSRGALPGPVSYFVSFPSVSPPPPPVPCPALPLAVSLHSYIRFLYPSRRHGRACSKIFNFGRWHVPGRRISSTSLFTLPLSILCGAR